MQYAADEDEDQGWDEYADNVALVTKQVDAAGDVSFHPPERGAVSGRDRDTSTLQTLTNLLKSFIASGILGLPFAFKQGGFLASMILLIFVAILATASNVMLVQCKQLLARRGIVSYADIGVYSFGIGMGYIIDSLLVFTQFGFCCVYLVFVAENLTGFLPYSRDTILLMTTPCFVAMSYIRTLAWISPVSLAANVALLGGLCIVMAASVSQLKERTVAETAAGVDLIVVWRTLPVTFGMAVFANEGIGVILPCETAMKNPKHFPAVIVGVMLVAATFYMAFGSVCYVAFGEATSDQILVNIQHFASGAGEPWLSLAKVARASLIFAIAATFPMQLFVITDILEQEYMFKGGRCGTSWLVLKANIFRTLLVMAAVLVAWLVPDLGPLISLIGSFGAAALQFVIPPMFYFKLFPAARLRKGFCILIILVGVVGGMLGTADSVAQLIDRHSR